MYQQDMPGEIDRPYAARGDQMAIGDGRFLLVEPFAAVIRPLEIFARIARVSPAVEQACARQSRGGAADGRDRLRLAYCARSLFDEVIDEQRKIPMR